MSSSSTSNSIDGQRVYDGYSNSWIPLKSRSDALLANLRLQHNLTFHQIELLLNVLQDPGFDNSEVSIKRSTDILRAISDSKKELAAGRLRQDIVLEAKSGIPPTVLDLVVETMKSNMPSFEEDARYFSKTRILGPREIEGSPSHEMQQILRQMTLVHRTWTPVARTALQRRIVICGLKQLTSFLSSVCYGPEVRELILDVNDFAVKTFCSDFSFFFSELPFYLPNIRSLCMKVASLQENFFHMHPYLDRNLLNHPNVAIRSIQGFKGLEHLWIVASGLSPLPWLDACKTVATFNSLRYLCFSGKWRLDVKEDAALELLRRIQPPKSLKAIELHPVQPNVPPTILTWLLLPSLSLDEAFDRSALHSIESVSLELNDNQIALIEGHIPEQKSAISRLWNSLQMLDCTNSSLRIVSKAIALCNSLQHLIINVELFWKLAEAQIPASLSHLTLTCHDVDFLAVHDKTASDLLSLTAPTSMSGEARAVMRRLQRLDFLAHGHSVLRAVTHTTRKVAVRDDNSGCTPRAAIQEKQRNYLLECMKKTAFACSELGIDFNVDTYADFKDTSQT